MSARSFAVTGANVDRPDERSVPEASRIGTAVCVGVMSLHLKAHPVDIVRLSDDEALRLAADLVRSVLHRQGKRS